MGRWVLAWVLVGCGGSASKGGETGETGEVTTTTTEVTTTTTTTEPEVPGGLAVAFVPFTLVDGENVLDAQLFDMGDGVGLPKDRAEVDAGGGVFLTGAVSEMHAPDFMPEASWVGAVQVPEEAYLPVELNGEVMGMWYMGPFDYHLDPAFGIRLTGVKAGGTDRSYELWMARYETSAWELVGEATFDDEGVSVAGDLSLVSTLVLMDVTGVTEQPEVGDVGADTTLRGTVVYPDGTPYEGGRVQFCREGECVTATTGSAGEYEMDGLGIGRGSFEVIPVR